MTEVLVVKPQARDQSNNELAKDSRNWLSGLSISSKVCLIKFLPNCLHQTERDYIPNV